MHRTRDVDEVILKHALQLLSIVRQQKPEVKLDFLEDIPRLLVYLFERITSETIPDELKPFGNVRERAGTLQMILDTLEQTLGLSLTHLSGHGLAQLDRRQLSDALEIFGDLVRHCFKSSQEHVDRNNDVTDGGSLTRSLLDMPAVEEETTRPDCSQGISSPGGIIPEIGGRYGYHDLDKRGIPMNGADNQHRPEVQHDGWSPVVAIHPLHIAEKQNEGNKKYALSTTSSVTLLKEIHTGNKYSQVQDEKPIPSRPTRKRRLLSARQLVEDEERGVWFRPEIANTTKNHNKSSQRNNPTPTCHSKDRFVPYRNETSFVSSTKTGHPVRVRKPSVKSFRSSRDITETTTGKQTRIDARTKEVRAEHHNSSVRPSDNVRSRPTYLKNSLRPPSFNSHKPPARYVVEEQTRRRVDGRMRNMSARSVTTARATSNVTRGTSSVRYQVNSPLTVSDRKRAPSVVSTKVRKHSCNTQASPLRRSHRQPSVRRGQVSPQTTSFCSSIKLLEEFDYVRRRLKEIQILKQEYLEAIKDLEQEYVRLEAVLLHVHQKSHVPRNKKPEGSICNGNNRNLGVAV